MPSADKSKATPAWSSEPGQRGAGASHEEILEDYAGLEEANIMAALEYAAIQTDHAILIAA